MIDEPRLVDDFLALCRINSPSREEAEVVAWLRGRLAQAGIEAHEDGAGIEIGGNAGNLIATLPATVEGAPSLLFSAHTDIVEPNPNVNIIREGDVIRTDGKTILGADDKAGVAPLLEAIRVLVEQGLPHGEVQAVFSVSEEVGMLGARHLDLDADMAFAVDAGPPVGSFIVNAPGLIGLRGKIIGTAAHAGVRPEDGVSAIEVAAEAIAGMKLGRLDEETTANIGLLRGGEKTNIVCPEVEIAGEARSMDEGKLAAQVAHMRQRFEEAAAKRGARAELTERRSFHAYKREPGEPVVDLAVSAAQSIGLSGARRRAGGGSDANVFNSRGLPSIVLCTGMQKNHSHDEFCTVPDLVDTARLIVAVLQQAVA